MSQFDSYNEQPKSNFKDVLRNLSNSHISDDQIKSVLIEILMVKPQYSNSQYGYH